jgi:hypothetical protein
VGALFVSQASAQDEEVRMGRLTVAVGERGTVDLRALDIGSPGLGAWEIGIVYDDSFLEAVDCDAAAVGKNYCNGDFATGRVQVVGATSDGETGDTTLATLTFECDDTGITSLTIVLDELADATEGGPEEIDADISHGSIACVERGQFDLGDVDCDGEVDSRDAALVLQFEARLIRALPCQHVADVNLDGEIDAIDAALILQLEAGLIDSLPAGAGPSGLVRFLF